MPVLSPAGAYVIANPGTFTRKVLKGFKENQGLLLAGAVAYYALLSVVPMLILVVIALSHVAGSIQGRSNDRVFFSGLVWSLHGVTGVLLYLLGLVGEVLLLTSIYMVMPVGRLWWRHALVGGVTAALLWEVTRRVLVW